MTRGSTDLRKHYIVLMKDKAFHFHINLTIFFFLRSQKNSVEMYLLRCIKLQKLFKTTELR